MQCIADLLILKLAHKTCHRLALRKLDRQDRPLSIVAFDRDSQAVQFVKPYIINGAGLPIGQHHGFADQLCLGFFECAENGGCTAWDAR